MFYFHTTRDAPNARVVAVNVNRPGSGTVVEVIPESNEALEKCTERPKSQMTVVT